MIACLTIVSPAFFHGLDVSDEIFVDTGTFRPVSPVGVWKNFKDSVSV